MTRASPQQAASAGGRKVKYSSTTIPAERSLTEIRRLLADVGAERFATLQDFEADTVGIQFYFEGQAIQLAIDIKAIEEKLATNTKIRREQRGSEAAERVAYRLLLNWLANNFELVRWGVFDTMEAFLPYMVLPSGQTLRELLVPTGPDGVRRLALPEAKEER